MLVKLTKRERESEYAYPDVAIVCPSPPLGGSDSIGGC